MAVVAAGGLVVPVGVAEVHVPAMAILLIYRLYKLGVKYPQVMINVKMGGMWAVLGGLCWLVDKFACQIAVSITQEIGITQPIFHALWHIFTGFALSECFCVIAYQIFFDGCEKREQRVEITTEGAFWKF